MKTLTQEQVLVHIALERNHQDNRWGALEERHRDLASWIFLLRQKLKLAEKAYMGPSGDAGALDEIRQLVACGVACMEEHGVTPRIPAIAPFEPERAAAQ